MSEKPLTAEEWVEKMVAEAPPLSQEQTSPPSYSDRLTVDKRRVSNG